MLLGVHASTELPRSVSRTCAISVQRFLAAAVLPGSRIPFGGKNQPKSTLCGRQSVSQSLPHSSRELMAHTMCYTTRIPASTHDNSWQDSAAPLPLMGTVPTVSPPSPSPSPTPSPTAYLPPHTDGAAPSRQPHPTAPPHLRQPHPAAPPTPLPSETASRASPTAQYRPAPPSLQSAPPIPHTPYRQTHADRYERPSLSSPPLPHTSRN